MAPAKPPWGVGPGKAVPPKPIAPIPSGGYPSALKKPWAVKPDERHPAMIRVTEKGRSVLDELRVASAFEGRLGNGQTVGFPPAAPIGAAFVDNPEEEQGAWYDVLLDDGPLSRRPVPAAQLSFLPEDGNISCTGYSMVSPSNVGGGGFGAENIRPWSHEQCRSRGDGVGGPPSAASARRSSTAEPGPRSRLSTGSAAGGSIISAVPPELLAKRRELHEQRELNWRLEAEDRERRIRQNRAKAHAQLKDRCLSLAAHQTELCQLTEKVLKPAMADRLKGLEKRHASRQSAFAGQLPPTLPSTGTATMRFGVAGSGGSAFDRDVASRKMEAVVGSPAAPRRNNRLLANLADLLDADLDAKAGEETAKPLVSRAMDTSSNRRGGGGAEAENSVPPRAAKKDLAGWVSARSRGIIN